MNEPVTDTTPAPPASGAAGRPTLTLDVALYEGYLADRDLDEAQKCALLEALWSIIVGFVDLGFAVEPAEKPSGDADKGHEEFASTRRNLVQCEASSTTNEFERAAMQASPASAGTRE